MDVNTLFAGAKGHPKLQWPLAWLAREIAPHDEPLLFVTAVMRIESGDGWAVAVPGGGVSHLSATVSAGMWHARRAAITARRVRLHPECVSAAISQSAGKSLESRLEGPDGRSLAS